MYIYIHEFGTYYAVKYVHVNLYTNRGGEAPSRGGVTSPIGSHAHAIGAHMLKNVYTSNRNQDLYIELCTIVLQLARRISNRRLIEDQRRCNEEGVDRVPLDFFVPDCERNSARNREINILKFL